MKRFIVGIGGMTNGGKSTLSTALQQSIPNSCIIAQDSFFKDDCLVPVDDNGFKQYDVLEALHMDKMISEVNSWRCDPKRFMQRNGQMCSPADKQPFLLIVEGFLVFNCRRLNKFFHKRYFLEIPYDACKKRRSTRVYVPPDPPGYFDGYVWPMYQRNRREMERITSDIVFLDGLKPKDEILSAVFADLTQEMDRICENE